MLIGMHGRLQAGKDTAMERIAYLMTPFPVVHVSYARKLKESVAALLGVSLADIEQWKTQEESRVKVIDGEDFEGDGRMVTRTWDKVVKDLSFREFLQRYGTEAHRDVFGEDFWLDQALPLDKDYSDSIYVVTDARFPNELARIKELGGITIRIDGPLEFTGEHRSETQHETDYVIDNRVRDDGFRSLDRQLIDILREIGAGSRKSYSAEQISEAVTNVKKREGMHPMDIRYRFASQRPKAGDEIG